MHFNDPVDKDASHLLIDVDLLAHIALRGQVLALGLLHVHRDRLSELSHVLWVVLSLKINEIDASLFDLFLSFVPELKYSLFYGRSLLFRFAGPVPLQRVILLE